LTSSKRLGLTAFLFLAAIVLHAVIILFVLPPTQLVKYSKTADDYLQQRLPAERLLDFSPLYLQLHVFAHRLFEKPNNAVLWIHLILTSLSACLFFQILLRFFPLAIALGGAITFILDRSVIVYTQAFEPEPLMMFLLLSFLFLIIQVSLKYHLLAGIALGLAIWTRPNFTPLLLVIPIYFFFRHPKRSMFVRSSLLTCVPILIALLGLWIRNASVVGYFTPIVMNPGTAFFEGNNPVSWGFSSIYPPLLDDVSDLHSKEVDYHHEMYRIFARKVTGKNLTLPEVNKFWMNKATNFLIDHPAHTCKLLASKFFHFFHNYQWHDLPNAFWNEQILKSRLIPTVPFALISAMTLFGMWAGRSRWKEFLIFYGMFISQFLFMMMIYVSARQRASILALFIFFACTGIHFLVGKRNWLRWLVLILPLTFLLYAQSDLMTEETRLWRNIRTSNSWQTEAYKKRGKDQLKDASQAAARALAAAPFNFDYCRPSNLSFQSFPLEARSLISSTDFSAEFDRALLSLEEGLPKDVQQGMLEIISNKFRLKRDQNQSSQPYFYLGQASFIESNKDQALQNFRTALRSSPGDPWTLAALAMLTNNDEYSNQLMRYFDEIDARFFLGQAALKFGNAENAIKNLTYVTEMLPEYRRGWVYLAASFGKANRFSEGNDAYKRALKIGLDPAFLEQEILHLYKGFAKQNSNNVDALYTSGFVFRQYGHYERALELQKTALQVKDSDTIRTEIATLEKAIASYK
jgi:tetratricopeptide (TPR) repeat protein